MYCALKMAFSFSKETFSFDSVDDKADGVTFLNLGFAICPFRKYYFGLEINRVAGFYCYDFL